MTGWRGLSFCFFLDIKGCRGKKYLIKANNDVLDRKDIYPRSPLIITCQHNIPLPEVLSLADPQNVYLSVNNFTYEPQQGTESILRQDHPNTAPIRSACPEWCMFLWDLWDEAWDLLSHVKRARGDQGPRL